ncbi:LiaI-LiaF-like domain-containing protein [Spirosoma montaniterrae]|uniref:LiaI-LiaF-like transmembrane region domain-containing protein n=1 Tax=Spirosoma montaniterrae TaxID=1178516 RepID=A0A1P9WUH6_9BACT|nr:DUF5668 domain-containing protein [Spirosoma montaniterrae]AQG79032.1 hypothetical protein AWR27_06660 [Spirosoma montaniterrae]
MQRRNGLFWGLFLLTLGVLFLARRAGWLDVDWHSLVNLWPVLLILAGINVILERQGSPAAFVTTVMLAVAVPTTLFGFLSRDRDHGRYGWNWHDRDDERDDENEESEDETDGEDNEDAYRSERENRDEEPKTVQTNTFVESMDATTNEAVLKLAGGAGRFIFSEPTTELIKAETKNNIGAYSMTVDRDATTRVPTIDLKPTEEKQEIDLENGKIENRVEVHLNAKPIWQMDIAIGAGQGDLDLSAYAVKQLKVEAGAADIDLKLGNKVDQADVKLNVGAASVTVRVPKDIGCLVKKDGALNLTQLDDFTDAGGGEFTSPGYASATKKITIRFDGGVSRFKVVRY